MKKGIVVVLILLLLSTLSCTAGPKPEIVGYDASSGFENFDYTVYITIRVKNNGQDGNIKVTATIQNGSYWKKDTRIFIASDQTEDVIIAFPEAELLDVGLGGYQYTVDAEPD